MLGNMLTVEIVIREAMPFGFLGYLLPASYVLPDRLGTEKNSRIESIFEPQLVRETEEAFRTFCLAHGLLRTFQTYRENPLAVVEYKMEELPITESEVPLASSSKLT